MEIKDTPAIDLETLERLQTEQPVAVYTKTIRGKVGVIVFNPITRRPEEKILKGDSQDPTVNRDSMLVKLYDEASHVFFKNYNRRLIESGMIVPFDKNATQEIQMVNAITDEEIDELLAKPYFALMNKLQEFTSPVPVQRILSRAIDLNKNVKTVERIKERISELQVPNNIDEKLKKHYQNLDLE